jgi:hypothetical protein
MRQSNRYLYLISVLLFCAIGAGIFGAGASAQDERWWIVRADYGFRNQRTDVTDILKELVARGGVNGRVAVNNQTMGGDPAVGKDKSLRIFAKNRRNEEREFNFNEGGFVDARLFEVRLPEVHREDADDRRPYDRDRDDRRPGNGDRDRDEHRDMTILRAYYGVQGRTVDVTELLRSRVRDGRLNFPVTNGALGGDPAIGADKVLIVVYKTRDYETATAVREGFTLAIP